ncbi:MAG TPA: hypothetical protein VHW60_23970 [Caulobacteraceae bacterium]|jgi:hypothetical protein|nr:hypothetical protein [Caulobacteraceae bacterium]
MKRDLGPYVVTKPRSDGTFRVLFIVPLSCRPEGWPATIPLPRGLDRTGDLGNADEVRRIRADRARLHEQMLECRKVRSVPPDLPHNLRSCVRLWQTSQQWKANRPRTQKGYQYGAAIILKWAAKNNAPVEALRPSDVEAFLAKYDDRPTQRYALGKTLRIILGQAVKAGWIAVNPAKQVLIRKPRTSVRLWSSLDVARLAAAARSVGQPGLAAIIHTQWEIGQRLTDVVQFRHGVEYEASQGEFRFMQSKTGTHVAIPVSRALRKTIAACRRADSPYLYHDAKTARPFDVSRLWHVFARVRPKGEKLVLRALRHSCVVELARAGCAIPEIVSISGHTLTSAHAILQTYLPRDSTVARNAQRKRGLI